MKTKLCIGMVMLAAAFAPAQTNSLTALLQQGLFEEQASRNFDAAIADYRSLAAKFDQDRQLAATAVFRLGECYRAQGKTNEAATEYQRVLRDFSDQSTLVTLSQQDLAGMGSLSAPEKTPAAANVADSYPATAEIAFLATQISGLEKGMSDPEEQARGVLAIFPDDVLRKMMLNLPGLQNQTALLKANPELKEAELGGYHIAIGPDLQAVEMHSTNLLADAQRELSTQVSWIEERVNFILGIQKARLKALRAGNGPAAPENSDTQLWSRLKDLPQDELEKVLPTVVPDTTLDDLFQKRNEVQAQRATLVVDYPTNNVHITRADAELDALNKQIGEKISGMMQALKLRSEFPLPPSAAVRTPSPEMEEVDRTEKILTQLQGWDLSQLRHRIPALVPDADFEQLDQQLRALEMLGDPAPDTVLHEREVLKQKLEDRADQIIKQLQRRAENLKEQVANQAPATGGTVKNIASGPAISDEESKEIARIQTMIQNSPDLINAVGQGNSTPLSQAAAAGWLRVAAFLLDHGAALDPKALLYATSSGNKAMVEFLLGRGADVDAQGDDGSTALGRAAEAGYLSVAEVLIQHHANLEAHDGITVNEETPLHRAAGKGRPAMVALLLSKGADVNATDRHKSTPAMAAIFSGEVDALNQLIKAGAKLDVVDANGKTALTYAAAGHIDATKALLAAKADPNAGRNGTTLFAALPYPEILKLLLTAGVNLNVKTDLDRTDRPRFGGNPNSNVDKGWTPLLSAIETDKSDSVALLVQAGADVNAANENGMTPLMMAVWAQDMQIVSLLLSNNVDINARHPAGRTALGMSKEAEHGYHPYQPGDYGGGSRQSDEALARKISTLLREHGALDNLPDWNRILFSRPAANYSATVFEKNTNDWNHFTLLEFICWTYMNGSSQVDGQWSTFPDLAHITVGRPSANGTAARRIKVDLTAGTNDVDCSRDLPLEFGDMVEVPEREHSLAEQGTHLSNQQATTILNYFRNRAGAIKLVVGGQTAQQPLQPLHSQITEVLNQARTVLTSSCDLSRVKISRHDIQTGRADEWVVDCSSNSREISELWLRAGDVVEVPPKPGS